MATRTRPPKGQREQETVKKRVRATPAMAARRREKNCLVRISSKRSWGAGHQLDESSIGLQRGKFGHVGNFASILHALFQSLPQIHYRLLVFALLGVGLGEEEVELRHFLHTALLQQLSVLAVVLENHRIRGQGESEHLTGTIVIMAGKVSHSEVRHHRGRLR